MVVVALVLGLVKSPRSVLAAIVSLGPARVVNVDQASVLALFLEAKITVRRWVHHERRVSLCTFFTHLCCLFSLIFKIPLSTDTWFNGFVLKGLTVIHNLLMRRP